MGICWKIVAHEHNEQARASHTKGTEGQAPVWGSEFNSKDAAVQGGGDGGAHAVVRGGARCAS